MGRREEERGEVCKRVRRKEIAEVNTVRWVVIYTEGFQDKRDALYRQQGDSVKLVGQTEGDQGVTKYLQCNVNSKYGL